MNIETKKLALLIGTLALVVFAITFQLNSAPSIRIQADLFSRWYATRQLIQTGRNLYDVQNMQEAAGYKAIPTSPLETGFFYPAHLTAFLTPLAILPYPIAHLIWTLIGQLFYLIGLWVVMSQVQWPETIGQKTLIIFTALFFIPFIQHTIWSQFDTIAVFGLGMMIVSLNKERYFSAGLWASLFTFKPQDGLPVLIFSMIWGLFKIKRWRFIFGFILAGLGLWAFAQALQPGWLVDFIQALASYRELPYKLSTFPAEMGAIGYFLEVGLVAWFFYLVFYFRNESNNSAGINLTMLLGIFLFWISFPIIGMMHLVLLPSVAVLLMASLKKLNSKLYRFTIIVLSIFYLVGYAGFIVGLLTPETQGDHIYFAELVYKWSTPVLGIIVSSLASVGYVISRRIA